MLVYQIVLITVGHMKPPAPRILIFLLRDTNVSRRKNDKMNMNGPGRVSGGGRRENETGDPGGGKILTPGWGW